MKTLTKSVTKVVEYRSMPTLIEQRNNLLDELDGILKKAKEETRALNDNELQRYDEIKNEIEKLNKTIKVLEEARSFEKKEELPAAEERSQEELEVRAFANFIRGVVEERADVNLTKGDNGAVVPKSIAQKIIEKVKEMSPIFQLATRYNVKGELSIPYYDESSGKITAAYATEFNELESTSGKFGSIQLNGFLVGVLTKISKSLVNNSDFDLVSYVVDKVAEAIALFIEKELLYGTANKIAGLSTVTQNINAASSTAVTADELIDLQESIPDLFQANAIWIMNKKTRTAIRKLKDNDGNYILNKDATARWGYTLFGKDVYVSDQMEEMEAGKVAIYYGDFSGLAVKLSEDINIQVLMEKYATQHAIGVVGFIELDAKVENAQKIAKLTMKA